MDTADPIDKYFKDIKNKSMEVTPNRPRRIRSPFLFPLIEIFFLIIKGMVINSVPTDLKNTIWYALKWFNCFTKALRKENARALIIINLMTLFSIFAL